MIQLEQKEKTRRIIGAILLCIGTLCILWGEQSNDLAILKIGKTTAAVGIILYFLGRIGALLRKN